MSTTFKFEIYKDDYDNKVFVEEYQSKHSSAHLWRYGFYYENCPSIVVSCGLLNKPSKRTLCNLLNSEQIYKEDL